jgi:hypothetical protein
MDFIFRLRDYLESNVTLNAPVAAGTLTTKPKSVAIRETPGSIPSRYIDKGKIYEFNFQVLVKDPDFVTASNTCHAINDKLDGLPNGSIVSQDGSFIFVTCQTYTTPNWVEQNEHGEHIYTALFAAELEK